ncbi:hypothetical protein B0I35DRAFT_17774 [Stachybotrys elegans]|uniref:Uncharacterized protein n=1 Tax=Stachybotrys elegans TaxID=80388 RepID=A0A8K0WW89_9HYPO|nr:hypothetical protein B0I35DRAFT_17774 [Stachybotrys elegans]
MFIKRFPWSSQAFFLTPVPVQTLLLLLVFGSYSFKLSNTRIRTYPSGTGGCNDKGKKKKKNGTRVGPLGALDRPRAHHVSPLRKHKIRLGHGNQARVLCTSQWCGRQTSPGKRQPFYTLALKTLPGSMSGQCSQERL